MLNSSYHRTAKSAKAERVDMGSFVRVAQQHNQSRRDGIFIESSKLNEASPVGAACRSHGVVYVEGALQRRPALVDRDDLLAR